MMMQIVMTAAVNIGSSTAGSEFSRCVARLPKKRPQAIVHLPYMYMSTHIHMYVYKRLFACLICVSIYVCLHVHLHVLIDMMSGTRTIGNT